MDILQINVETLRWLHSVLLIDHSVDLGLTRLMRHLHHLKETANINNGITIFSILPKNYNKVYEQPHSALRKNVTFIRAIHADS